MSHVLLWTRTHQYTSGSRPAKIYVNQLSLDTGYQLVRVPRAMIIRDRFKRERERERERGRERERERERGLVKTVTSILL